jgi:hypothetical protein
VPRTQNGGKCNFFNSFGERNWISTGRRVKLDCHLTPYTKISSNWIKCLNVTPQTLKLLEESIGTKLHDIGLSNEFFHMTPKAQATEAK